MSMALEPGRAASLPGYEVADGQGHVAGPVTLRVGPTVPVKEPPPRDGMTASDTAQPVPDSKKAPHPDGVRPGLSAAGSFSRPSRGTVIFPLLLQVHVI